MNNPFDVIDRRLSAIESVLQDIRSQKTEQTQIPSVEPFGDFGWLCATCSGIPASTLRIKSAAGQISGTTKVGRRVLYDKAAVLAWLRSNPVLPTDAAVVERNAEAQVDGRINKRATNKAA